MKIQCPFDPTVYSHKVPMGMFHCEVCGEMQVAGIPHLPKIIEISQGDYDIVLQYNKDLKKSIDENYK
jgi:hypothetical protein